MVEGLCSKGHLHLLGLQLGLQLPELLLQDERGHLTVHVVEYDGTRQPVQELRLEGLLHLLHHGLASADAAVEADAL